MKKRINLDKNQSYILACSYGPDSMALFDILIENSYSFCVCFVNYHLRKESDNEEKGIKEYCSKNNIQLYVKEAYYSKEEGNVEGWARDVRYKFFEEMSQKTRVNNLLIAHNQDDLIETYLLQKERNNIVSFYGLSPCYQKNSLTIYRPLLDTSKADLLSLCKENNVPFAVDFSNFDNKYKRNKLRNTFVKNLNEAERNTIIKEINDRNEENEKEFNNLKKYINNNEVNVLDITNLDNKAFNLLLILLLKNNSFYTPISLGESTDIFDKIKANKNFKIRKKEFTIYCSYNILAIVKNKEFNYCEEISKSSMFRINNNSDFLKNMDSEKLLFIKTVKPTDEIEIKGYKKKVSRLFIDQKIPYHYRLIWPGIYDNEGKLLYMPHYQKNYNGEKPMSPIVFDIEKLFKS